MDKARKYYTMSLDLLLMCFRDGEPATFNLAIAESIFARGAVDWRVPLTGVRYANGGRATIDYGVADNEDDVQYMMFTHFRGSAFFDALYELARQTRSVLLLIVENNAIAVTDHETIDHLPPGFADGQRTPVIVSNSRELVDCLFGPD